MGKKQRTIEQLEHIVCAYIRKGYYQSLDRNGQLHLGNSVMHALHAQTQEDPEVLMFWNPPKKAKRKWVKATVDVPIYIPRDCSTYIRGALVVVSQSNVFPWAYDFRSITSGKILGTVAKGCFKLV